jgi:hypothetical protein
MRSVSGSSACIENMGGWSFLKGRSGPVSPLP